MYGIPPYSTFMSAQRNPRRELKTERLELRVSPLVRKVIERASAVSGLAAGDLAFEGARRILDENERLQLLGDDRELFLEAVARPPRPRARLIAALRAHGKLK